MLPELPAGSTIDITTTSPGGVGAPVIVNAGEECDLVIEQPVGNAVIDQNVKARVKQDDLQHAARCGVLALDVPRVL